MSATCGKKRRCLVGGLLAGLFVLTAGCGSSKGTVSGKVLYKGQPLPGGTVTFIQAKGAFSAQIREDGTYSIAQVPVGEAKIIVETKTSQPTKTHTPRGANVPKDYKQQLEEMKKNLPADVDMDQLMPMMGNAPSRQGQYVPISEHYGNPEKSGLTYTVVGGEQKHDIELK